MGNRLSVFVFRTILYSKGDPSLFHLLFGHGPVPGPGDSFPVFQHRFPELRNQLLARVIQHDRGFISRQIGQADLNVNRIPRLHLLGGKLHRYLHVLVSRTRLRAGGGEPQSQDHHQEHRDQKPFFHRHFSLSLQPASFSARICSLSCCQTRPSRKKFPPAARFFVRVFSPGAL